MNFFSRRPQAFTDVHDDVEATTVAAMANAEKVDYGLDALESDLKHLETRVDVHDERLDDADAATAALVVEKDKLRDRAEKTGAFYLTLVPVRPRRRGERRFLRTFPVASLRRALSFNTRPRRLSTPLLTPFNSTPTALRTERPTEADVVDVFDELVTNEAARTEMQSQLATLEPKVRTLEKRADGADERLDDMDDVVEELADEAVAGAVKGLLDVEVISSEIDPDRLDEMDRATSRNVRALSQLKLSIEEANLASKADVDASIAKLRASDASLGKNILELQRHLERNIVATQLQAECDRIEAEEFTVARVDDFKQIVAGESNAREASLIALKTHVLVAVAEEANARRRGDDDVRHAYEDDVANLEDTASAAVRELREGLRAEVTERTYQANALHRDLGEALDVARARLEADVRALEETAAGNIAAQKLEEEMMRAELDDATMRLEDALQTLQEDADARAAEAAEKLREATTTVTGLVEVQTKPVLEKCEEVVATMESTRAEVRDLREMQGEAQITAVTAEEALRAELTSAIEEEKTAASDARYRVDETVKELKDAVQSTASDAKADVEVLRTEIFAELDEVNSTLSVETGRARDARAAATADVAALRTEVAATTEAIASEASKREEGDRAIEHHLAADLVAEGESIRAEVHTEIDRAAEAESESRAAAIAAFEDTLKEGLKLNADAVAEVRFDLGHETAERTKAEESFALKEEMAAFKGEVAEVKKQVEYVDGKLDDQLGSVKEDVAAAMKAAGAAGEAAAKAAAAPPPAAAAPPPPPPP
jgi:hypothetical protein